MFNKLNMVESWSQNTDFSEIVIHFRADLDIWSWMYTANVNMDWNGHKSSIPSPTFLLYLGSALLVFQESRRRMSRRKLILLSSMIVIIFPSSMWEPGQSRCRTGFGTCPTGVISPTSPVLAWETNMMDLTLEVSLNSLNLVRPAMKLFSSHSFPAWGFTPSSPALSFCQIPQFYGIHLLALHFLCNLDYASSKPFW